MKTDQNKHTPTPWKQVGARVYAGDRRVACCDHHAPHVADPVDIANAAFIALACNAHDALVEAVRTAIGDATRYQRVRYTANTFALLNAALAKAEGPV